MSVNKVINLEERLFEAEKSLNESNKRYEKLVEASPNAIFTFIENCIVFANKAAVNLVGACNSSDIIGQDIRDILRIEGDSEKKAIEYMLYIASAQKDVNFTEYRLKTLNDKIIYIDIAVTSFIESGKLNTTIIARDITDRKIMEQKLRKSEKLYRTVLELLPDALFLFSNDKHILSNQAALDLLGINDFNDIKSSTIREFNSSNSLNCSEDNKEKKQDIKRNLPFKEQKLVRANGEIVNVEVASTSYIYDDSEVVISIVRDITERNCAEENKKELEKAKEYDRVKTEFFSNLSHEFKTPLNILLGSIQLIGSICKETEVNLDKIKLIKYTNIMKQNCYRLLRLINNLIDITRLDVGYLKMNFRNHNVVEIVENIVLSVADYIESKKMNLVFDTDNEEIITYCDADKVERIILNLLSNAVKFTEPGGNIYVNMNTSDRSFRICVKDTGIGIPEDMRDKIFDRFKQVEKDLVKNKEGSGIGLSIVKSIVEAHNGKISVSSEEGKGSEFIIEIPIVICENEDKPEREWSFTDNDKVERINVEFSDIYS
jgi:PAS domain S-box-containing protein